MKLKINRLFGPILSDGKETKIDFLKRKNLILMVFAALFVGLLSTIVLFFVASEKELDFTEKKTIELPFNEPLEEADIADIKNMAIEQLKTPCYVQKTVPFREDDVVLKNKLTISFYKTTYGDEDEEATKKEIHELVSKIKEDYSDLIPIKLKEEILINTETIANIEDFTGLGEIFAAVVIVLLIALYLLITYRKINGFLVVSSFMFSFLFNIVLTLSFFIGFNFCLGVDFNNSFLLPISIIICISSLTLLFNTNFLFKNLNDIVINKDKEKLFLTASNDAINKSFSFFSGNFIIFAALPTISFIIFSILNYALTENFYYIVNILPFILIYFVVELFCFVISLYLIPAIYNLFKKKKA